MLIKTTKSDPILNFLKQDFLVNQNIIGILENLPGGDIYVDNVDNPTGVLVKKDDYMHYVYTKEDGFIDNMCENYFKEGFFGFSGVEEELAEKIRARYQLNWESRCTVYYLPEGKIDASLKKNPTQRIKLEDAETVDKFYQYRDPGTLEVIKRDITNRPSSAVYVDGEIACWVLIHDDNSMGIMYTKEAHRRKGYAVDVTVDLVQQIIEKGNLPYLQIVEGNGMSPGLAAKCGFVKADKRADWFGIVAGNPKELAEANDNSRKQFLAALPEGLQQHVYKENIVYHGLYIFLYNFKYTNCSIEGTSLVKVENERNKSLWCDITSKSLAASTEALEIKNILLEAELDSNFNLYLLFKDGLAIGASTTYMFGEGDRGIHMLSVLPEYRDTAVWKILIEETMQYEKEHDCYFVVMQTVQEQVELLTELGFRETHKITV